MSKHEIVEQLHSWLTADDFTPEKEKISSLTESYDALREASMQSQLESFLADGGTEEAFEYHPDQEDHRMDELVGIYHDRRKEADKKRFEQEKLNLSEKKDLVKELHGLIQDEENIAKAYQRFNAIKQKWNEIGPVPQAEKRELQTEYSRLIEVFYYNINIYRELQINDLRKNQELKLKVIEEIKLLEQENSINQVDFLIHQYLHEWDEIGPTFREEWEKIREEFKVEVGKVFDRIREHRNEVKQEHHQHFEAKKALVEQVERIAEQALTEVKEVQVATREVIALQKQWKKIGYAGRGKNDRIWGSFRKACDAYFAKRDAFMAASNQEFDKVKEAKRALIDRAKEIHASDDTRAVANELKNLQRKWKETGKLLPHEEFKLFKEFRKYCDAFFNQKKKADEASQKANKEALQKREAYLAKIDQEIQNGLAEKGEQMIENWRRDWSALGEVHAKMRAKVDKAFEQTVLKAYKSLGISQSEVEEKRFASKLELLTESGQGEEALKRERSAINQHIRDKQTALAQEESKLDFFKYSDEKNPLKKELLSRIQAVQDEIDALREKKKKIDLAIKGAHQATEESHEGQGEAEGSEA
jgi:hypothetical protein